MSILSCEIRSEIDGLEQALVIPKPSLESLPHDLPAPVPVPVPVQLRAVERYQINNSTTIFEAVSGRVRQQVDSVCCTVWTTARAHGGLHGRRADKLRRECC